MDSPHMLRCVEHDGTIREIELTLDQALDLSNGRAIAYHPRDERLLIDPDGRTTRRESAVPQTPVS